MKLRKTLPPLTPEEELEICKKCDGFCCKYYFFNASKSPDAMELHKFRNRKIIKYGNHSALILKDVCPWCDDENHMCTKYESRPRLCKSFPETYRPFWNLRCKLMRARYARGMIPKNIAGFNIIKNPNKSPMKIYKEK